MVERSPAGIDVGVGDEKNPKAADANVAATPAPKELKLEPAAMLKMSVVDENGKGVPNPNPQLQFPVHQLLITRNGIYIFENLATEELARDRVYEFAFFFAPLKLKGATGSPGNPLAIR